MTTTVDDNPRESRFEISVDEELVGFVDYRKDGNEYALPHTRIFDQFRGKGLGHALIEGTLDEIATRGGKVLPYCPFIPPIIHDHPEFIDLVPAEQRAIFGL